MKTLKKIGNYFLQIAEIIVLFVGLLVIAVFVPSKVGEILIEGVEKGKKEEKSKKAKKK